MLMLMSSWRQNRKRTFLASESPAKTCTNSLTHVISSFCSPGQVERNTMEGLHEMSNILPLYVNNHFKRVRTSM